MRDWVGGGEAVGLAGFVVSGERIFPGLSVVLHLTPICYYYMASR